MFDAGDRDEVSESSSGASDAGRERPRVLETVEEEQRCGGEADG